MNLLEPREGKARAQQMHNQRRVPGHWLGFVFSYGHQSRDISAQRTCREASEMPANLWEIVKECGKKGEGYVV